MRSRSLFAVCVLPAWLLAQQPTPPVVRPVDPPAAAVPAAPPIVWRRTQRQESTIDRAVELDGALYLLDRGGSVQSLDARTGEPRWRQAKVPMSCMRYFGITVVAQQPHALVVVGCDEGLRAFRTSDGELQWRTDIARGVAGPAVAKGHVVAGGADGNVYGCDLKTGAIVWKSDYLEDRPDDPPGFVGSDARFEDPARPCGAATDGDIVALSIFDQCRTLAFDPVTGKRLWSFATQGWMYGEPSFGPLFVYVGSQGRGVYAIDKQLGKQAWKTVAASRNEAPLAVTERFVYQASCDGTLRAIDVAVDRVKWTFQAQVPEGSTKAVYSKPVVVGDLVVFATLEGTVFAVDRAKGTERWRLRPVPGSRIVADLVHDGERLFVVVEHEDKQGSDGVVAITLK